MNRQHMTGAQIVVRALKDQGVDTIFGYPGGAVLPIYDALYQWGAVIIGPRAFELALDAHASDSVPGRTSPLRAARLRTARYRAARLARLAGVLADERHRRERLEL